MCTESKQLLPEDLKAAEHLPILTEQKDTYSRKYKVLKESKELTTSESLSSFKLMITNNLIRIGGRLSKDHLPYESKHQILLNKDHPLSRIIFNHYHEKVHHAGREQALAGRGLDSKRKRIVKKG